MVEERPVEEGSGDVINSINRYVLVAPFCLNKKVLDYGCGYGFGTHTLTQEGVNVVGLEPYPEVINAAKIKFPNCRFQLIQETDFSQFNMISCMEVIEHLEDYDLKILLSKFSQVGQFIGSTPNGNVFVYKPKSKAERRGFHVCHYTYLELIDIFRRYWKKVDVFGCTFDPKLSFFCNYMIWARNE